MTNVVQLREVVDADLPIFFEQQLHPAANFMAAFTARDPADRAAFDAHWARIRSDSRVLLRTILLDDKVVGYVGMYKQAGEPEVTYWLGQQYWGRGLATQALSQFLVSLKRRPLYARAAKDHVASIRVLEKCGFTLVGEDRGFAKARGEEIEEVILKLGATSMPALTGPDYYLSQKQALLKGHRRMLGVGHDLLRQRYGAADTTSILAEADAEFEALIPQIPYIGGAENTFTDTLVQMTTLLALYRVLQRRGVPVAEIGHLVYEIGQRSLNRFPAVLRRLIGRVYMTRWWRQRTARKALASQQRRYPGDFVYELVEGGPGTSFSWGVNYHECGVVKFFAAQGADEFTPYMCVMDYLIFPAMGVGLQRQGTLAHGCTHCDFRYRWGGETPPAWPPPFLKSP